MPSWEGADSPEEIWDLVSFIRHLPQLSPEELKQMKKMTRQEASKEKARIKPKPPPSLIWINRVPDRTHT
jgi:hypothetical protein